MSLILLFLGWLARSLRAGWPPGFRLAEENVETVPAARLQKPSHAEPIEAPEVFERMRRSGVVRDRCRA
jgi:hypothetical protein